jgi:hypothetical protein
MLDGRNFWRVDEKDNLKINSRADSTHQLKPFT